MRHERQWWNSLAWTVQELPASRQVRFHPGLRTAEESLAEEKAAAKAEATPVDTVLTHAA